MKMSLSHVLMKAWRVPVFWVLAFSVLVSIFKGTTSQCSTGNRPLILSTVSDYPNRLSTDHLSLPTRNINCQWKITARVGDLIALTVMNIDLISSYNCPSQSITIYDGETENNRNLGNYCGRQRGQILYSSTRYMLIKFISIGSLATGGFNLSYAKAPVDSACRTGTRPKHLTGYTSYFTELRFPSSGIYYLNNALCDWLISVPNGYVVQIRVNSINMEQSSNCTYDRMDIYDGSTLYSPLLARICRNYYQIVNGTTTYMFIHFTSDSSYTGTGFIVNYKAVLKSSITTTDSACRTGTRPTRLTGSTSVFTELRFPNSGIYYPNNALCDWLISVSTGYIVQLRVNSVNMETFSGCRDRLDIYDGSTDTHLLARICTYYSQTVNSSGTNMLIRFTSDSSFTGSGFSVSYKAVFKYVDVRYHGDYTSQSSPSTASIIGGVVGACLVLIVLCVIIYQCRKKLFKSPARRSNVPVVNRDNVSSRNRRTQTPASQDRQDVYTLPTSSTTTTPTVPYFTNYAYSTFGDELPSRNVGENQYQSTNFTGIGPPDYSDAPPPYSEVVNGCYTHDS